MVVFVELPNEVALVRQAEDRAHRKGQRKAVNVYFLCAKGTCDDRRWQHLNNSLSQITQVSDVGNTLLLHAAQVVNNMGTAFCVATMAQ